jgi:hypothetical protein
MQYDHDRREEWFDWLLNRETTAPWTIRAALESVPTIHWLYVETRLRGVLPALSGQQVIPLGSAPADATQSAAAVWKATLFQEEATHRSAWLGRELRGFVRA